MTRLSLRDQIIHQLDQLSPQQQRELLDFAKRLSAAPQGTPGEVLLEHMDRFHFEPGDVDEMMQAIEEGCERIDWDGWQ